MLDQIIQEDTHLKHGSIVQLACEASLELIGPAAVYCNDGQWNASLPACKGLYFSWVIFIPFLLPEELRLLMPREYNKRVLMELAKSQYKEFNVYLQAKNLIILM